MTTIKFGEKIKDIIVSQKLNSSELAKDLGISRSHLYKIMDGETYSPSIHLVNRICRRLNIPMSFALGETELKFKRLSESATLPTKAHDADAGMDLYASSIVKQTSSELWFETGIAVEIPVGFAGLIFPRSSISKIPLTLANSVGLIDSGYRGGIQVRFNRIPSDGKNADYAIGDRVAQLVIVQIPNFKAIWADELEDSDRGTDGWGSSGN